MPSPRIQADKPSSIRTCRSMEGIIDMPDGIQSRIFRVDVLAEHMRLDSPVSLLKIFIQVFKITGMDKIVGVKMTRDIVLPGKMIDGMTDGLDLGVKCRFRSQ